MKRLIAAAVLILIIAAACISNSVFINKTYKEFMGDISEMQKVFESDHGAAAALAGKFESKWAKKEDYLSIFVNHDIVDTLGVSIAKLPVYAEKNSAEMFISECRSIEIELMHMLKDAQITAHSVF